MKLAGIFFLTITFSSCRQNKLNVTFYKTNSYTIADSTIVADKFLLNSMHSGDYPIYYIGAKVDTIKIGKRYWAGRTKWTNDAEMPWSRNYSGKNLFIFVDTAIKTNSPDEYISDNPKLSKDSTMNYNSFLFSITNISDCTIYLGKTFSLFYINREAKNKKGDWVKVDKKLSELGICTTGESVIFLRPNQLVLSKIKRYKGSFVTDFRLVFGYENNVVYSNIFRDSIDERMLQSSSTNE